MNELEEAKYIRHMSYNELATTTQKNYLFYIKDYYKYLDKNNLKIKKTNLDTIQKYIEHKNKSTKTGKKLATNSVNLIKASLRVVYTVNEMKELIPEIKGKKPADTIPRTLKKESLERIFKETKSYYKEPFKNQRNWFLLTFFYQTGARLQEALNITKNDIDFVNNTVILGSKGSEYLRKLKPLWLKKFGAWLKANKINKFVFVNQNGSRLSARTVEWFCNRVTLLAVGEAYSPHRFRATCITHRLEKAEDFFSASANFHKNPNTTKRYVGGTARSLEKMVNPFDDFDM